jgi:hypothetical protein
MPTPTPNHHWYHVTPARFFIGLLVVQVLLLLADLESVSLHGTQVTGAGIHRFQQALPNCKIYHHEPRQAADPA